jgi:uncharacterized protein YggL (DUF469 family)
LDVAALYPSIPIDLGLQAVISTFEKTRSGKDVKPSNNTLMKFLEAVLKKNSFTFNGNHYLQVSGTAIGMMVAPSVGNRFLHEFEIQHVYTFRKQPLVWWGGGILMTYLSFGRICGALKYKAPNYYIFNGNFR